jgi:hypothetical protein
LQFIILTNTKHIIMAAIQDASGKMLPSWARHVEQVAAAGSFTGHKDSGGALIPFAVYLYDDSTISFKTVDEQGTTSYCYGFNLGFIRSGPVTLCN